MIRFENCLFEQNEAEVGGILYVNDYGSAHIIDSNVKENYAAEARAIYIINSFEGSLVRNTSFSDAQAISISFVLAV